MKLRSRLDTNQPARRLTALALLFCCGLAAFAAVPGGSQVSSGLTSCFNLNSDDGSYCKAESGCIDPFEPSPGCTPLPTSLRPLGAAANGGVGWIAGKTACGVKKCYIFFGCCCGRPLGVGLCGV